MDGFCGVCSDEGGSGCGSQPLVQMPEMNGLQSTMQIRQEEAIGAHVQIVAMTASAMSEERDRCLAAGMDDFISKPVSYKS